MDVTAWLTELGFEDYIESFSSNGVDHKILLELTNDDLKDLDVGRLADRKRLLKAIAQLTSNDKVIEHSTNAASRGERRHVTVLFADLAGFTALSTQFDPEELHNLLTRFYETVDPVIEKYGGTVDKHLGDGIMALFGAPIAHGDDPLRAVRTAFDIHQAMEMLSLEVNRELCVHIGIALGEVIAGGLGREGHKEYTVIGDSVNLASRLDGLANDKETMIDPSVYSAVQDHVHCHEVGPSNIKGFSQPINVWKASHLLETSEASKKTIFVGRRSELRQIDGVLQSCLEDKAGQIILIRGEAGIGKSRLLEEIENKSITLGLQPYKTLVLDFGVAKGQDAIAMLLNSLIHKTELTELLATDLQPFLRDLLGQDQLEKDIQLYKNLDNQQRQKGKERAISKVLQKRSSQGPIVLIIEDVHWIDQSTLDYLIHIATIITNAPIVLVMSTRIEGDPIGLTWRNSSIQSPSITLDIGPLRPQEVTEFSKGFETGHSTLFAKCVERAEGNPLFLEQLFKNVSEADDQAIPASIQSLILSRADRLPLQDKEALQAASVIGKRFDLESVQHLLSNEDYDAQTLIERQMIRPTGDEYLFSHALMQESIYLSLLKKNRHHLHIKAASYYDDKDKLLQAEHLGRAKHPMAAQAYLNAAVQLIQQYKFDPALPILEKGIDCATSNEDRFYLLKYQALALRELGQVQESVKTYKKSLPLAPFPAETARIWIEVATGLRIADLHNEALNALKRAKEQVDDTDELEIHASIHHMRGNIYFPMGRIDDCKNEHERSFKLAQKSGSSMLQANALSGIADAYYMSGKMASACHSFTECVDIAEHANLRTIASVNRPMIGFSRLYMLELPQALADAQRTIEEAKSIFFQRGELLGEVLSVFINFELADFNQATKHNKRALELSDQLGALRFEAQALMHEGRIAQALDDPARAMIALEKALNISEQIGHGFTGPRIMAAIAQCTTDEQQMCSALSEGHEMIKQGSVGHNPLYFYPMAIEVSLQHKKWDLIETYCAELERYTKAEPLAWSDLFIRLGRTFAQDDAKQKILHLGQLKDYLLDSNLNRIAKHLPLFQ